MRKYMMMVTLAAAALVSVLPPLAAQARDTRPTIAVLSFDNNSIGPNRANYDGLEKGIADFLITELATKANARIVERDVIQKIIDELNLSKSDLMNKETAVRVGKLVGAHYMVKGGFMAGVRDELILDAQVVSVETSEMRWADRARERGDNIIELIEQMAGKMTRGMKLPALEMRSGDAGSAAPTSVGAAGHAAHGAEHGAAAGTPVSHPTTEPKMQPATQPSAGPTNATATSVASRPAASAAPRQVAVRAPRPSVSKAQKKIDLRAALLYSQALGAEDARNTTKAIELYRAVVDRFPEHAASRAALAKLTRSAGD